MQVSPFSSMVSKGHFSWHAFSNIWKCLLFASSGFTVAQSIDSAMLSFVHETFLQMAPGFESKSAYFGFCACTTGPKVALVSFGAKASATLGKNHAPLIFMIFRSKYSRAITVGMYACIWHWLMIMYYQTKLDNKRISTAEDIVETVMTIWTLAVTLTLKIAHQPFCMTLLAWWCITIPSLETKCLLG